MGTKWSWRLISAAFLLAGLLAARSAQGQTETPKIIQWQYCILTDQRIDLLPEIWQIAKIEETSTDAAENKIVERMKSGATSREAGLLLLLDLLGKDGWLLIQRQTSVRPNTIEDTYFFRKPGSPIQLP